MQKMGVHLLRRGCLQTLRDIRIEPPHQVRDVFLEWLRRERPDRAARVENAIRDARGGALNDARWGKRMRGEGERLDQIGETFNLFTRRLGLDAPLADLDSSRFRPPAGTNGQMSLWS